MTLQGCCEGCLSTLRHDAEMGTIKRYVCPRASKATHITSQQVPHHQQRASGRSVHDKAPQAARRSYSVPVDGLSLLLDEALPEAEYAADQARPAAAERSRNSVEYRISRGTEYRVIEVALVQARVHMLLLAGRCSLIKHTWHCHTSWLPATTKSRTCRSHSFSHGLLTL